ncbi:MAG: PilN domain-containing protein [Nitrospirota bacterium]|nr:MAG: PilN domain-containing protein [Nitrospirota bacterium]
MSNILDIHILRDRIRFSLVKKGLLNEEPAGGEETSMSFSDADEKDITKLFSELKDKHAVREVRVFLPFFMCLLNILDLPLKKKSDIEDALQFELGDALPLPADRYISDFRPVGRSEAGTRVLVLSVMSEMISKVVRSVNSSDMEVISIRCGFLEQLGTAIGRNKKSNMIFISVEGQDIVLSVIKDGEVILIKKVTNDDNAATAVTALRDQHQVQQAVLAGVLDESVKNSIGVSVLGDSRIPLPRSSSYALELLSSEIKAEYIAGLKRYAKMALALSALFLVAGFTLPVYKNHSYLKGVEKKISEIKDEASGQIEKRKDLDISRKRIEFLTARQRKNDLPRKVLGEITNALPEDAWVINFSMDEKGFIELKGFSDDASGIVEILEGTDMFRNVGFSAPMVKSGGKTRYSIKMELEK